MKLTTTATKLITRTHIALYRKTGGKLGGRYRGSPVLLLTTTGRRSGQRRTMPLLYIDDGKRMVVAASYLGAEHHPAWYHNLLAQPEVTVQAGSSVQPMRAEVADPAERARLWSPLVAMYPTYDDYQAKTERQIPIIVLTPHEPTS
jgi:F420H(2)-dependent quinone reductase